MHSDLACNIGLGRVCGVPGMGSWQKVMLGSVYSIKPAKRPVCQEVSPAESLHLSAVF